jgi:hypothetical protein
VISGILRRWSARLDVDAALVAQPRRPGAGEPIDAVDEHVRGIHAGHPGAAGQRIGGDDASSGDLPAER